MRSSDQYTSLFFFLKFPCTVHRSSKNHSGRKRDGLCVAGLKSVKVITPSATMT